MSSGGPFYLAVDAGGTKTDFLLADGERVLARARTGTIKRLRADAGTASANLSRGLAELTAASGVGMEAVSATCIGTAGETVPLVTEWLRAAFAARVGGGLLLLGDVEIALDAAFPAGPGVVAIAGTGSNVAGRTHAGRVTTAGGWGPALGDQGSGHRIGEEALRAVFRAMDEADTREEAGSPTTLLPAILDAWELDSVAELVELANGRPGPEVSQLAGVVLACALGGDEVAQRVLRREGEKLAGLIAVVMRRLQREATEAGWVPAVAFTGSVFEKVGPVREAVVRALEREFAGVEVREGVVGPILGALYRARGMG